MRHDPRNLGPRLRLEASDGGDPWDVGADLGPWHVTGAVILGTAAAGMYSANRQASAANKPRNSSTSQTTTQVPYHADQINPDIDAILRYQRGMVERGSPQVDAQGNVYYQSLPTEGNPYTSTNRTTQGNAYAPASGVAPGGGGARAAQPARSGGGGGGGQNQQVVTRNGVQGIVGAGGGFQPLGAAALRRLQTSGGSDAGTGSGGGTTPQAPAGPNLSTPQGIFGAVAQRGLDAGNTQTQSQARNVMANIWGDSANPGSAGGERTGFEGYNPILDRYAQTLEGDVGNRAGRDLLLGFLNENGRGGGGSSPSSVRQPTQYTPDGRPVASGGYFGSSYASAGPGGVQATPAQTGVPDTVGGNNSFFAQQIQQMFNEGANNAELQAVIDAMNADTERGMYRDLAQLDASAQGTGRFGGGMWKGLSNDARRTAAEEMTQGAAQVRVGDREARRQALLNALGQVNTRDLGLLGANVQREGIAASERASGNASAAASAGMADQLALARRGQDLSAISALMDSEQYSMGQLGNVGGQLSSDRLSSLGMVPGLEGIGLNGLQMALGAGGGMVDLRGQDIQRQIAGQQAGIARQGLNLQQQGMNQQLGMYNASQQQATVNDYLRTLLGIGGMGGTSNTQGTNVQPGLGVSPTSAAIMGGLGAGATAAGVYVQGRQAGAW